MKVHKHYLSLPVYVLDSLYFNCPKPCTGQKQEHVLFVLYFSLFPILICVTKGLLCYYNIQTINKGFQCFINYQYWSQIIVSIYFEKDPKTPSRFLSDSPKLKKKPQNFSFDQLTSIRQS